MRSKGRRTPKGTKSGRCWKWPIPWPQSHILATLITSQGQIATGRGFLATRLRAGVGKAPLAPGTQSWWWHGEGELVNSRRLLG